MHQTGLLKGDDMTDRFFRVLTVSFSSFPYFSHYFHYFLALMCVCTCCMFIIRVSIALPSFLFHSILLIVQVFPGALSFTLSVFWTSQYNWVIANSINSNSEPLFWCHWCICEAYCFCYEGSMSHILLHLSICKYSL